MGPCEGSGMAWSQNSKRGRRGQWGAPGSPSAEGVARAFWPLAAVCPSVSNYALGPVTALENHVSTWGWACPGQSWVKAREGEPVTWGNRPPPPGMRLIPLRGGEETAAAIAQERH